MTGAVFDSIRIRHCMKPKGTAPGWKLPPMGELSPAHSLAMFYWENFALKIGSPETEKSVLSLFSD